MQTPVSIPTTAETTKSSVLTFESAAGVSVGMVVYGTANVPNGSKVRSVTATTVTLYVDVSVAEAQTVNFYEIQFHPEATLTDLY